jgi:predicted NBD/HSP70 family sugar kinase
MKGKKPHRVLVLDVGGSHVKFRLSGRPEVRVFDSGPQMTASQMAENVKKLTVDWRYDAVSIGYPGIVIHGRIAIEPHNLGSGWVGFDFAAAFGKPTRIINDAAMQAIGSYQGGRMLFLGLGTGLGTAMIVDGVVESMELAHMNFKKNKTFEEYAGDAGRRRLGSKKWRHIVNEIIEQLRTALEADNVVIGGGNARRLRELPEGVRLGSNELAFEGGFRMWSPGGIDMGRAAKRG